MVLHRVVPVVINGQHHCSTHAATVSMPHFVSYLKIMSPEPFRLHTVHPARAPLAALGGDRFGVGNDVVARLVAPLPIWTVDTNLSFGCCA